MAFLGMGIGGMLVAFLASAALLVLLYMTRQKRRRLSVPFVGLFDMQRGRNARTPFWSRLRHLWSLLLLLCIAGLLVLALGDPRWGATQHARSVVFVVDTSWSMAAREGGKTRLDAAQATLRDLVAGLGSDDRALILAAGARPEPVTPWTSDHPVLQEAIDRLQVSATDGSVAEAIVLGTDFLRDASHAELVLLSDHSPSQSPVSESPSETGSPVRFVYLPQVEGERAAHNPAIVSLSARRYPLDRQSVEALVTVLNPDAVARTVKLHVLGDNAPLFSDELTLPAGGVLTRVLEDLPAQVETLQASIEPTDALPDVQPEDSRAFAAIPSRQRIRVGVVSKDNLFLSAALLLDGYLDVVEVDRSEVAARDDVDVWIFDGARPTALPKAPAIYLHPSGSGYAPFEPSGPALSAPYFDRVDRDHPLSRYLALRDVNIKEALRWDAEKDDRVVGASESGPLLVAGNRGSHAFVAVAFDPRASDLPLRAAFPLLLMNAVHFLVQAPVDEGLRATVGRAYTLRVPKQAVRVLARRVAPAETAPQPLEFVTRPVDGGSEASLSLTQPGVYDLSVRDARARVLFERRLTVAHAASGAELGLHRRTAPEGDAAADPEQRRIVWMDRGSPSVHGRTLIWPGLIGIAFMLLAFEWLAFHRRWTS